MWDRKDNLVAWHDKSYRRYGLAMSSLVARTFLLFSSAVKSGVNVAWQGPSQMWSELRMSWHNIEKEEKGKRSRKKSKEGSDHWMGWEERSLPAENLMQNSMDLIEHINKVRAGNACHGNGAWQGMHFEAVGRHGGQASKKFLIRTLNVSYSSHSKASHAPECHEMNGLWGTGATAEHGERIFRFCFTDHAWDSSSFDPYPYLLLPLCLSLGH